MIFLSQPLARTTPLRTQLKHGLLGHVRAFPHTKPVGQSAE